VAEKIEFDLVVKTDNGLNKALSLGVDQVELLGDKLKNAVAILNKPSLSSNFSKALAQNTLLSNEFRVGAAASFGAAKQGADEATVALKKTQSSFSELVKKSLDLKAALSFAAGTVFGNVFINAFTKIKEVISNAVSESINFKRSQLEIETILPKNTKLTKELVKQLEDLSKQYGTSSTTQAKAYYEIISAGVEDAADGAKLLARANALATGGVTDTASTIDLLTTIYNVYGKEVATAAEASDSLFKTVQIGKTTISELSADLGQALPIAKSFGIGLDEVGSILAQLTNSGISTSESVTLLNAVLSAIAKNGDKLGAGFNSTAVQTEGLGVVLDRLKERTNGSNDALFKLLGRQEAVRAVQSLTAKGLDNYNATLAEYSNKAGVAAAASKKILDGDIGKQFDILGSKISSVSRGFIDFFLPAVLDVTKAVNNLFGIDTTGNFQAQIEDARSKISQLNEEFKRGATSQSNYNAQTNKLKDDLARLLELKGDDPLATIDQARIVSLKESIKQLNIEVLDTKSGFAAIDLGPIEKTLKLDELNSKIAAAKAEITSLTKIDSGVSNEAVTVKDERSKEAIANEQKLQIDLAAIKQQFAIQDKEFEDQRNITSEENRLLKQELEINALYEQEAAKLAVLTDAQFETAALIKDGDVRRLTQEKITQEASLKAQDLTFKKEAKLNDARVADKELTEEEYRALLSSSLSTIATLQTSGNKTLVAVGKAAALAQLATSAPIAVGKALELGPILGPVAAAAMTVAFAAQAAKIAGVNFENGGVVGQQGASVGPDNRVAQIRDGEMILNAEQQKTVFDAISSGSLGGQGDIIVQVDGREIARAVRTQVKSGFVLA
jgi:TP901 family phage tail tape measure protein